MEFTRTTKRRSAVVVVAAIVVVTVAMTLAPTVQRHWEIQVIESHPGVGLRRLTHRPILERHGQPAVLYEQVSLNRNSKPDTLLPLLKNQFQLKSLIINLQCRTDRTFELIAENCANLEVLEINESNYVSSHLRGMLFEHDCQQIERLRRLRSVKISALIGGDGLAAIARLPELTDLHIHSASSDASCLAYCENLRSLSGGLTSQQLVQLATKRSDGKPSVPQLKAISVLGREHWEYNEYVISDEVMSALATLPMLESLQLMGCRVSMDGLHEIARSPRLNSLLIGKSKSLQSRIEELPQDFRSRCAISFRNDDY